MSAVQCGAFSFGGRQKDGISAALDGVPDGDRTHNLQIRNLILYPIELRKQNPLNYFSTYCYNFDMTKTDNIRLIVCDIDNTVLPYGEKRISERLKNDLNKAEEKGIFVMIDTGRHYTFIPPSFFEDLPMKLIGTINGACLTDREGHTLEKDAMSVDDMNQLTRICEENNIGLGFKFEDAIVTYANHDKFVKGYCTDDYFAAKVLNDDAKRTHHLEHGCPLGTFIIGDEEVIEPLKHSIDDLVFAWSAKHGYDVFLKRVTKATAVEHVLKRLNLTWDNVIGFGDAGNDTPFIEKAAIGVALGNSKDDVKEHADIIADDCRNDGVAKVLEELHLA